MKIVLDITKATGEPMFALNTNPNDKLIIKSKDFDTGIEVLEEGELYDVQFNCFDNPITGKTEASVKWIINKKEPSECA